ncbi:MAG: helix-turn-helix transcriptional regulator [Candidatus Omnitrophica bacterium]|nr:helix-turn-helix transcriptional regulator [Candidatus Omnitrophota bacterium]
MSIMGTAIRLKLAKRIRQLRKKNNYTQEKLSELAKIDYKYIQKIEGKNPPAVRIDTLEKLARAFKISLSTLLRF